MESLAKNCHSGSVKSHHCSALLRKRLALCSPTVSDEISAETAQFQCWILASNLISIAQRFSGHGLRRNRPEWFFSQLIKAECLWDDNSGVFSICTLTQKIAEYFGSVCFFPELNTTIFSNCSRHHNLKLFVWLKKQDYKPRLQKQCLYKNLMAFGWKKVRIPILDMSNSFLFSQTPFIG